MRNNPRWGKSKAEETPSTVFIGTDGLRRNGPDIWADEEPDGA